MTLLTVSNDYRERTAWSLGRLLSYLGVSDSPVCQQVPGPTQRKWLVGEFVPQPIASPLEVREQPDDGLSP